MKTLLKIFQLMSAKSIMNSWQIDKLTEQL